MANEHGYTTIADREIVTFDRQESTAILAADQRLDRTNAWIDVRDELIRRHLRAMRTELEVHETIARRRSCTSRLTHQSKDS